MIVQWMIMKILPKQQGIRHFDVLSVRVTERFSFFFSRCVPSFLQNNSLQLISKHAFSGLHSLKRL